MLKEIPTNCRPIDEFLKGGFPVDTVALIYGEAETGKTTLAMQCATSCGKQGYKTLFVDSDRTFSAQRLSQIVPEKSKVPELIILARPNDFREQTTVVDQLTDYVNQNFKLVVFDTITSLYRLRIAESPPKTFELNRELNRQLASLAQAARTQRIVVLLTSQVHSVLDEVPVSIAPVATRVLKFWADTVIAMKLTENPQAIEATVEKNPANLPPMTCSLRIEERGIH
ncbi:MAG: ATPase domain-containing protein [Candidatus Bathyarchaeia archaeon]